MSNNLADLLAATNGINRAETGSPLTMEELFSYEQTLKEALNLQDPHYRYEVHVTESIPTKPSDPLHAAQRIHKLDDSRTAVLDIFARCRGSFVERPIDRHLVIQRGSNSSIDSAVDDFIQFGSAVELPPGSYELTETLPMEIPEPFSRSHEPTGKIFIGMESSEQDKDTWLTFSVGSAEEPFISEHSFCLAPPH